MGEAEAPREGSPPGTFRKKACPCPSESHSLLSTSVEQFLGSHITFINMIAITITIIAADIVLISIIIIAITVVTIAIASLAERKRDTLHNLRLGQYHD